MRTLAKSGVLVAAVLAVACSSKQPAKEQLAANDHPAPQQPSSNAAPQEPGVVPNYPAQTAVTNPAAQSAAFDTPAPGAGTAPDERGAKTDMAIGDAEILGIAMAANEGEVQEGELVKTNGGATDVKEFGALMVKEHSEALNKERQLQSKAKIAPKDSDVSNQLKSDTQASLANLRNLKGNEFDRVYIDTQVRDHKTVLRTIDDQLLPHAQNSELKSHLKSVRHRVADHLARAEKIQKRVDPSAAAAMQETDKGSKAKEGSSGKAKTGDGSKK